MIFENFSEWNMQNILIRIIVSTVIGTIIGFDRGMKHRGAGTKTITVVCLGATLVMLTEQYIQFNFPGLANMTRMAAQVISGVGFLGVGTIIVSNHQVKGLTTAATLWASACVGLSIGIGFLEGGVLITLMMLISLHVSPHLEKFLTRNSRYFTLIIDIEKVQYLREIISEIKGADIAIESLEIMKPSTKGQPTSVYLVLRTRQRMEASQIYDLMMQSEKVISMDFLS
ncbi:MAG: MgtC/SapB family protein [Lachnospiraceae bacterium]|nr:MgtC/SapB family protein [Lachnospiraceae bacterium]